MAVPEYSSTQVRKYASTYVRTYSSTSHVHVYVRTCLRTRVVHAEVKSDTYVACSGDAASQHGCCTRWWLGGGHHGHGLVKQLLLDERQPSRNKKVKRAYMSISLKSPKVKKIQRGHDHFFPKSDHEKVREDFSREDFSRNRDDAARTARKSHHPKSRISTLPLTQLK